MISFSVRITRVLTVALLATGFDAAARQTVDTQRYPVTVQVGAPDEIEQGGGSDAQAATPGADRSGGEAVQQTALAAQVDGAWRTLSCRAGGLHGLFGRCVALAPGSYHGRWKNGRHTELLVHTRGGDLTYTVR